MSPADSSLPNRVSLAAVVVGSGVGGLSAAIHLRLAGLQVHVFEQSRVGGKAAQIEQNGFTLDPGPSIFILPQILEAVFSRAGRSPTDYIRMQRLDPITRVFVQGAPDYLDLPASSPECVEVTRSISHMDADALENLLTLLDGISQGIEQSIFSKPIHSALHLLNPSLLRAGLPFAKFKSYKHFVDSRFSSPLFKAFFYGFPSYSGQSYDSRSMGSLLIPYYMLKKGVYYPEGGIGSIPRALERLALELGIVFHRSSKVTGFSVEKGRVKGVVSGAGDEMECGLVVSNMDRLTTELMLGRAVTSRPSYSYFTLHLGIARKFPHLSHHMLLIPSRYEHGFEDLYRRRLFPDPAIVYLNVTSELDPSTAPDGCTNLFAVISSPALEDQLDWDGLAQQGRRAVFGALARHGWTIDENEIVMQRMQTPAYFAHEHGNYKGSLYGPAEHDRFLHGMFPLRCKDEYISNLFYAGGSVQPGAGLPMVTLSGKFAADLAVAQL